MPRTLIRAFDSYTSTDGGNTWTRADFRIAGVASHLVCLRAGRRRAAFQVRAARRPMPQTVKDVLGSTTRNASWELDGYSNYTNGSLSNAASGQSRLYKCALLRLHAGARLLRQDLLHLAPRPAPAADDRQQLDRRSSSSSPTSATPTHRFQRRNDWSTCSSGIYNVTADQPAARTGPGPTTAAAR